MTRAIAGRGGWPSVVRAICAASVVMSVVGRSPAAVAQESARGVVFEDRNGNGLRDGGEPGVAGVVVSNQQEVVVTDEQGSYVLPVSDDTIIFVSKPSGYGVPLNKNRLPQFYYIHKPGGSPKLHYRGVAPTGPLPDSVDFPLTRTLEPDVFSIVALADPQPEMSQEVHYIREDVLSELVGTDAAFGVTLGDIVYNRLDLYNGYNAAVGWVGIPFYNIIGNHDLNFDADDDRDSDETFHRHFGPNYYSWNYGKVHFVALDDVEWIGSSEGRGHYREAFDDRQLGWLAADLEQVPDDRLVVLLMHIPITASGGFECHNKDKLFAVLKNRSKILALNGHMHLQEHLFYGAEAGWIGGGAFHQLTVAAVCGTFWSGPQDVRGIPVSDNLDGVPNGYTIVTFTGSDYVTDFKAAGFDRDHQMRIYPPGSTGLDELAQRQLLVNVFNGSERCKVEYRMDEGPFLPMTRSPQHDPLALAMISGVLKSTKHWTKPSITQHIWSTELAEPPARGTHVVTIRATDQFGRVREQSKIFTRSR